MSINHKGRYYFKGGLCKLKPAVAAVDVRGEWESSKSVSQHHRFKADSREILNYWESTGTILFQGRRRGPLERQLAAAWAAEKGKQTVARRPVVITDGALADPWNPNPHSPIRMPAMEHPSDSARAAVLNERSRCINEVFKGVTPQTAASELLLASLRQAQTFMTERQLHAALCATAGETIELGIGYRLFAQLSAIFHQVPVQDL